MKQKRKVVSNIRMQSAAGWYIGSVEFYGNEAEPYDRHSPYYPHEEFVRHFYPNSISMKQAFEKVGIK